MLLLQTALSHQEKIYSTTDLEILGTILLISHFHTYWYLYGNDVEVRTDHSAVKVV